MNDAPFLQVSKVVDSFLKNLNNRCMPSSAPEQPSPLSIARKAEAPLFGQPENQQETPQQEVLEMWAKGMGKNLKFVPRDTFTNSLHANDQQGNSISPSFLDADKITIPNDLHMWELIPLLKELDTTLPKDLQQHRGEKLEKLGTLLAISGRYLAQQIPLAFQPDSTSSQHLAHAQQIAQQIAQEFYLYGTSLATGQPPDPNATMTQEALTLDEMNQAEAFLLGKSYQKRLDRTEKKSEKNQELLQQERLRTIRQYFRAITRGEEEQKNKPEATELFATFLKHAGEQTAATADKASTTLTLSLLDQGMQYLRDTLLRKPVANTIWSREATILREQLKIDETKQALAAARAKKDNTEEIARLEKEAADIIQGFISNSIPRNRSSEFPRDIVTYKEIQCVGASLLGTTFLAKLGIKHLVIDTPNHSSFLVVYADDSVWLQDMLSPHRVQLTEDDVTGSTLNDIRRFADPNETQFTSSLPFTITPSVLQNYFGESTNTNRLTLLPPTEGLTTQILSNKALALEELGRYQEALAAYDMALSINPNNATVWNNKGATLHSLGKYEESLEAYRAYLHLLEQNNPEREDITILIRQLKRSVYWQKLWQKLKKIVTRK